MTMTSGFTDAKMTTEIDFSCSDCMQFQVTTEVDGYFLDVFDRFDRDLLEYLIPKFPPAELTRWDGHDVGAEVHAKIGLGLASQTFSVKIIEREIQEKAAWFTDFGLNMPWPIQTWKHTHRVEFISQATSRIVDDVSFTTSSSFLTKSMKGFIKSSMKARSPQYQEYFSSKRGS